MTTATKSGLFCTLPTEAPVWAVVLDFSKKTERVASLDEARAAVAAGLYAWIDLDLKFDEARAVLQQLSPAMLPEAALEAVLTREPAMQSARYGDCLHLAFAGCELGDSSLDLSRVDAVVGRGFLLTVHHGPVRFLHHVRAEYSADFLQHAKSPSFLLYELWDHLIENYLDAQNRLEQRVEKLQRQLIEHVDDSVFRSVADMGSILLHFRALLLPARSVLAELSSRRSEFISEATQPYLANMVGTIDRVLQDVLVDRELLSETLTLHTTMTAHRTNAIVTRLTIFSVIFMPLTFLCGIWGMNFENMPELAWQYGYGLFWFLAAAIVCTQLYILKRKKWL